MDVAAFLGRSPPFDALTPEQLERLAGEVDVMRVPAGDEIVQRAGEAAGFLYIVRGGAVELLDDGRLLDLLGEGEIFDLSPMLGDAGPTATMRAHEDSTCYRIPTALAEELLGTATGRSFVLGTFRDRSRRRREAHAVEPIDRRYRPVGELIRRSVVQTPPETSVADAARLMADERISSVLVPTPDGWGIVTDRDLRTRVLAAGLSPTAPVEAIASVPIRTVDETTLAGEALLRMFTEGVHHFPVADAHGGLVGVVTDTDLLDLGRHTPFAIRSQIERAGAPDAVSAAGRELPMVVVTLVDASADPVDVGRVVALVIDSLTRRLLELGIEEHGEPPAPWSWLALGSAARREQALRTDQDHALAYDAPDGTIEAIDPYFSRLAAAVTDGLERAGIPRCVGDVMATHPSLRRTLVSWSEAMHTWMDDLSPRGSELSSIVYDYRGVAGPLEAEAGLDEVIRAARRRPSFLRALGRRALELRPPTGFFRDLVVERRGEHAGRLDVKHGGITIVGNLARVQAVAAGVTAKGTVARLRTTTERGTISATTTEELVEAFHYLWEIRLRHQAEQVKAGQTADDFVDPSALGPVARRGLKEAFEVISRAQRELAIEMGLRLG